MVGLASSERSGVVPEALEMARTALGCCGGRRRSWRRALHLERLRPRRLQQTQRRSTPRSVPAVVLAQGGPRTRRRRRLAGALCCGDGKVQRKEQKRERKEELAEVDLGRLRPGCSARKKPVQRGLHSRSRHGSRRSEATTASDGVGCCCSGSEKNSENRRKGRRGERRRLGGGERKG